MSVVIVFARLLIDENISNHPSLAFDFNPSSNPGSNFVDELYFKKETNFKIDNQEFVSYSCRYSKVIHQYILVLGSSASSYEVPVKFKAFRRVDSDIIFFVTNTKDGNRYIKRINKHNKSDVFQKIEVDFISVAKRVHTVVGGWFSVPSADISTHSIHGASITESTEYKKLCRIGTLTSINITYIYYHNEFKVFISGKGSLYLVDKTNSKDIEKLILLDLFEKLILNSTR